MNDHPIGEEHPPAQLPSLLATVIFRFKALCFQSLRLWRDWRRGGIRKHPRADALTAVPLLGAWSSELWRDGAAPGERRLQLGKVQNLRMAAAGLDGVETPAGETFSFWRQIGRATRRRGFAVGRELRDGCLIPTVGGGLCQLSGALYNAALAAGLEVVERHAHSHRGVGTLSRHDRDATVFWNYVDLRLRAPFPWRLEVELTRDRLEVRIRGREKSAPSPEAARWTDPAPGAVQQPNSCATCGIGSCFRHAPQLAAHDGPDRTAVLVDEWQPEWETWLSSLDLSRALLCAPLDGRRFRKPNYQWDGGGFGRVHSAAWLTLRRAWATRRLRAQGAARQRALLAWDEKLARAYARRLRPEHSHLVVAQNLLPFLWRDGVLGGRTFDVLMHRLPLARLHLQLDFAASLHPESGTCADFRAPDALVAAETAALDAASRWVTPHARIAELGCSRAVLLPWNLPRRTEARRTSGRRIVFAGSTLCRKGAYEMREAARALDFEVTCLGGFLEGADFWAGVKLAAPGPAWWEGVCAVALPAFVENRPRRLLEAAALGIPVIASRACGLHGVEGVIEVPEGDADAWTAALRQALASEAPAPTHA